jgi:ribosome maturation factor RimP
MNQTVAGSYFLEVSSPGLDRPLRTLAAVERFAGQRAVLTTRETHEGRRNYEGVLLAPRDGQAGVRTDEGNEFWFGWADVKDAHLKIDPWSRLRGAGDRRPDGGLR